MKRHPKARADCELCPQHSTGICDPCWKKIESDFDAGIEAAFPGRTGAIGPPECQYCSAARWCDGCRKKSDDLDWHVDYHRPNRDPLFPYERLKNPAALYRAQPTNQPPPSADSSSVALWAGGLGVAAVVMVVLWLMSARGPMPGSYPAVSSPARPSSAELRAALLASATTKLGPSSTVSVMEPEPLVWSRSTPGSPSFVVGLVRATSSNPGADPLHTRVEVVAARYPSQAAEEVTENFVAQPTGRGVIFVRDVDQDGVQELVVLGASSRPVVTIFRYPYARTSEPRPQLDELLGVSSELYGVLTEADFDRQLPTVGRFEPPAHGVPVDRFVARLIHADHRQFRDAVSPRGLEVCVEGAAAGGYGAPMRCRVMPRDRLSAADWQGLKGWELEGFYDFRRPEDEGQSAGSAPQCVVTSSGVSCTRSGNFWVTLDLDGEGPSLRLRRIYNHGLSS
jgi:hypothetical protein